MAQVIALFLNLRHRRREKRPLEAKKARPNEPRLKEKTRKNLLGECGALGLAGAGCSLGEGGQVGVGESGAVDGTACDAALEGAIVATGDGA